MMFVTIVKQALRTDSAACEPFSERATTELGFSDMIINGDLLRFKNNKMIQ